jgi:hypothetical protein
MKLDHARGFLLTLRLGYHEHYFGLKREYHRSVTSRSPPRDLPSESTRLLKLKANQRRFGWSRACGFVKTASQNPLTIHFPL